MNKNIIFFTFKGIKIFLLIYKEFLLGYFYYFFIIVVKECIERFTFYWMIYRPEQPKVS